MFLKNLSTFGGILLIVFSTSTSSSICSGGKNEFENHLGTKTPYRIVANYNCSKIHYEGCEAKKLWAMVRHGTRNPSLSLIDKMRTRLVQIRDLILENSSTEVGNIDLDLFQAWTVKLRGKDEKKLTLEGEDEMLLLAERLQNRFPDILSNIYSESLYKFKYTATQRTKKSAEKFAAGLFGRGVVKDVYFPEPLKKDPVLRFYKLCDKWRNDIKKNPRVLEEMKRFHSGPIMNKTIENVNRRLGFKNELTLADVHAMYMTCAFETAWNKRKRSPWCSPFSVEDFKVLEYGEDLKYYWIDGYGHELTYKQACAAIGDLFDFFQNNATYPKSTVYFTHSGTLLKLLAHMELYKDANNLKAKDFLGSVDRQWRVSRIDSFATNLIFVLFDCKGEKKVLTLHQEHIVNLPSCPKSELCNFEKFFDYYGGNSECQFDQMCDNEVE